MGRRPRQSGHLQGQFPLRRVAPNQARLPSSLPQRASNLEPLLENPNQLPYRPPGLPQTSVTPPTDKLPASISPVSARSTLSHGSGANSAATTSYTSALAYARRLSPDADTPTSSVISSLQSVHETSHVDGWPRPARPVVSDRLSDTGIQMTEDVVGIGVPTSVNYPQDYLQPPQFVSPRGLSPGEHQRYPHKTEPWSTLPFRHEDHWFNGDMDTARVGTMDCISASTHSQSGQEKGGRRKGPLSREGRQQASDCDTQLPCTNCLTKERRKIPKQCIQARFDWKGCKSMLFPEEITCRLQKENLARYLSNATFIYSARPKFQVPLELNVGSPLYVTVKEFCPLHLALRHAHVPIENADGSKSYTKCQVWSPPIIMFIKDSRDLERQVKLVRQRIVAMFAQVLDDPQRWRDWTVKYFPHRADDFQTTILEHIGLYYRKDIKEHAVIKTALSLLWFMYLLWNKFTVPTAAVPQLEEHIDSRRPVWAPQDIHVIPDTINRFLKAIIMPMAMKAARKITATLHDMLFQMSVTQKQSTARTDIALCLAFVLLMFVGQMQAALVLLADTPASETGMKYSFEEAETKIRAIEQSVNEYLLSFHKFTLSRRSLPKSTGKPGPRGHKNHDNAHSMGEIHAQEFGLVGRLRREVEQEYGERGISELREMLMADIAADQERPEELELGKIDFRTFPRTNVARLCWKLFLNVEDGEGC
ncbi:hypothetical protein A1O3_08586 [Capronia epimyces CBS 606.96]|uniref:Uncharacterized protein n=1 Tax=Capronia epimyces CBS 606.96 TaxID=1182542 RepID=W9XP32_9EURO|nr:uncharacterized protein A1O3_08586 [Capronia epimyces CBS 606.96]EXJ79085.1 hypothetical protein A1O3_08586 [Capronia epimyces CBS 606.96]